jgi:hypothetical protein
VCREKDQEDGEVLEDWDLVWHWAEMIQRHGEAVACREWDSGGPGGGAGAVTIYEYGGLFYGLGEDCGPMFGPYMTKEEAVEAHGIYRIDESTDAIYDGDIEVYNRKMDEAPRKPEDTWWG